MKYREAYDKIIDAYFKDEIRPFDAEYCFCGTLCGNSSKWIESGISNELGDPNRCVNFAGYSSTEWAQMEFALCKTVQTMTRPNRERSGPIYEDALFNGMSAALDVLKQIHIERGEVIDEPQPFIKRELKPTL